jgi:hypothetical protein
MDRRLLLLVVVVVVAVALVLEGNPTFLLRGGRAGLLALVMTVVENDKDSRSLMRLLSKLLSSSHPCCCYIIYTYMHINHEIFFTYQQYSVLNISPTLCMHSENKQKSNFARIHTCC